MPPCPRKWPCGSRRLSGWVSKKCCPLRGPRVRIHLPPPASLRTFGPPPEGAGRRFKPIELVFGSVSLKSLPIRSGPAKEVQVHLQQAALDDWHRLPYRAAVAIVSSPMSDFGATLPTAGAVVPTARSPSGGMALAPEHTIFASRCARAYDDGQSTAYDRAGRRRWRRRRLRRGPSGGQRRRVAPTGWCRTRRWQG